MNYTAHSKGGVSFLNMYRLENKRVVAFYRTRTFDEARLKFERFFPPHLNVDIEMRWFTDEVRFARSMKALRDAGLVEPCIVNRAIQELIQRNEGCLLAYKHNEGIAKPIRRTV